MRDTCKSQVHGHLILSQVPLFPESAGGHHLKWRAYLICNKGSMHFCRVELFNRIRFWFYPHIRPVPCSLSIDRFRLLGFQKWESVQSKPQPTEDENLARKHNWSVFPENHLWLSSIKSWIHPFSNFSPKILRTCICTYIYISMHGWSMNMSGEFFKLFTICDTQIEL